MKTLASWGVLYQQLCWQAAKRYERDTPKSLTRATLELRLRTLLVNCSLVWGDIFHDNLAKTTKGIVGSAFGGNRSHKSNVAGMLTRGSFTDARRNARWASWNISTYLLVPNCWHDYLRLPADPVSCNFFVWCISQLFFMLLLWFYII